MENLYWCVFESNEERENNGRQFVQLVQEQLSRSTAEVRAPTHTHTPHTHTHTYAQTHTLLATSKHTYIRKQTHTNSQQKHALRQQWRWWCQQSQPLMELPPGGVPALTPSFVAMAPLSKRRLTRQRTLSLTATSLERMRSRGTNSSRALSLIMRPSFQV